MTLDESTDGLDKVDKNGLSFFLDPNLVAFLKQHGDVNIDFVQSANRGGFMIRVGSDDCSGGCSSGGCS
jgi:Fe-S cluster assembly iron-binding protein IscA